MLKGPLTGGKTTYGEVLGIIMIERHFPRIPGEMGNASTFEFPVRLRVVKGVDVSIRRKMHAGDSALIEPFILAARELEADGVKAITSNCGFLVKYQDQMADAVDVPVFASSLLQIPIAYQMLRRDQIIGVLTADARPKALGKAHFEAAGAKDIPIVVAGMQDYESFKTFTEDRLTLDPEAVRDDLVDAATKLLKQYPKIGAFVLECANMPPYSKWIHEAVGLPIFDFYTLTRMVYAAVVKKEFEGIM
ncbi:MAG: aspartate/glutamate racemase family protein [Deltaproteobacteria bacterium]|nr:aspartate/glutamate racemase family protein [Deltaproteobacteria bacterium]